MSSVGKFFVKNKSALDKVTIIGITGRKRSGKDTLGRHLVEKYGFVRLAYADSLKKACQSIFGFTDEQVFGDELKEVNDEYWNHTPREILQYVGTELFRNTLPKHCENIGSDIWIRSLGINMKRLIEKGHRRFVITDMRFDNEIDYIKSQGGLTLKVTRPSLLLEDNPFKNHASEVLIDGFECDFSIVNDSTIDNLYSELDSILGENSICVDQQNDQQNRQNETNELDLSLSN